MYAFKKIEISLLVYCISRNACDVSIHVNGLIFNRSVMPCMILSYIAMLLVSVV